MQAGRDDDHGLRNRSFALKDVSARTWIARSLTAEEVRTLADAIDAHYRVAIPLAANAGIRAGELWALRRRDVDLLRGVLHVRQTVKRDTAAPDAPPDTVDRYGREVGPPKNGRPRTITLGKATGDLLTAHLLAPAAGGTGPDALVFQTPGGRAVRHVLFIRKVFRPALKSLPTDKRALRFHDLRHTCASLLAATGAPVLYIKERLGYASVTTTVNQYGHMFPAVEASLADTLDAMYGDPQSPPSTRSQARAASSAAPLNLIFPNRPRQSHHSRWGRCRCRAALRIPPAGRPEERGGGPTQIGRAPVPHGESVPDPARVARRANCSLTERAGPTESPA